jgi:hypothetical protein
MSSNAKYISRDSPFKKGDRGRDFGRAYLGGCDISQRVSNQRPAMLVLHLLQEQGDPLFHTLCNKGPVAKDRSK